MSDFSLMLYIIYFAKGYSWKFTSKPTLLTLCPMLAKWCYQPSFLCPRDKRESRRHSEPSIILCLSSHVVKFRFSSPSAPTPEFQHNELLIRKLLLLLGSMSLYISSAWTPFFLIFFFTQPLRVMSPPPGSLPWIPVGECSSSPVFLQHLGPISREAHITEHCRGATVHFPHSLPTSPEFLQRDWYFYFWISCTFSSEQHIKAHLLTKWI